MPLTRRRPETSDEILKFGHYYVNRKFNNAETQTDDENIKDYYKVNNQIRINVLDLDFHNIGKLNSEVRIATDEFFVPPRKEMVNGIEIDRGKVDCEDVICCWMFAFDKIVEV